MNKVDKVFWRLGNIPPSQYSKRRKALLGKPLSPRQDEVIRMVVEGFSNIQIAGALAISHQTVKNHVTDIFAKLGVTHRTGAAVQYLQEHPELLRSMTNVL